VLTNKKYIKAWPLRIWLLRNFYWVLKNFALHLLQNFVVTSSSPRLARFGITSDEEGKTRQKISSASTQNGKTEVLRGPQPSHNPRPTGLSNGISSVKKRGSFFRLAQFSWYAGGPWKRSSRRQYLQSTVQLNGKSLIQNDNCHSAHSPLSRISYQSEVGHWFFHFNHLKRFDLCEQLSCQSCVRTLTRASNHRWFDPIVWYLNGACTMPWNLEVYVVTLSTTWRGWVMQKVQILWSEKFRKKSQPNVWT